MRDICEIDVKLSTASGQLGFQNIDVTFVYLKKIDVTSISRFYIFNKSLVMVTVKMENMSSFMAQQ